jgi:hypothetical protein
VYNQAISSTVGFGLSSFESAADLDFPVGPDCRLSPPDDEGGTEMAVAHVTPIGWMPNCHLCPPDDDVAAFSATALPPSRILAIGFPRRWTAGVIETVPLED